MKPAGTDTHWQTLDGRLTYVSGKTLLARVRQRLPDSYGVSFGNEGLASAFAAGEVPQELSALLDAVRGL